MTYAPDGSGIPRVASPLDSQIVPYQPDSLSAQRGGQESWEGDSNAEPRGYPDFTRVNLIREVRSEHYSRRRAAGWADADLYVSALSVAGAAGAESFQTDLQQNPGWVDVNPSDFVTRLAEAPWDWKAMALVAGAFALTNAAARLNRDIRFPADTARAADAIALSDGFVPSTEKQNRHRRLLHRVGRGVVTLASCGAAYVIGEHTNVRDDTYAGTALLGVAALSVMANKAIARAKSRRR